MSGLLGRATCRTCGHCREVTDGEREHIFIDHRNVVVCLERTGRRDRILGKHIGDVYIYIDSGRFCPEHSLDPYLDNWEHANRGPASG